MWGGYMGKGLLGSLELNRIYQMDCLEGMKLIPDKSIDMILCDLPYGTTRNKWDSVIPLDKLWKQYERVIKDNGAIVLTSQQPFTTKLIQSNIKLFRYEWIWHKSTKTGFLNAHRQPLKNHETICVFYKKLPNYQPQTDKCEKINRRGKIGTNYMENYANEYIQKEENYPTSIIFFKSESKPLHPTQKPVQLFEYLIKTYTKEGDIILDNCIGSGTTAIAATISHRRWLGFEIEPKYIEISNKRLDAIQLEDDLKQ